jgi:tetratricopeptide (TPR) repeat protein
MRTCAVLVLAALTIVVGADAFAGAAPPGPMDAKSSASWWIATYGLMDPADSLARRAQEVFRRVGAAADKRSNRLPKLVLLRRPVEPQSKALPDGSVLLNRAAIELCYRGGREAAGDAKLAFVVGHELSHLANDDFWGGPASFGSDTTAGALSEQRMRERKADSHGIVYAALAGYDPHAVTSGSFLAEWVSPRGPDEAARAARDQNERVELIRADLLRVVDDLEVFSFGVRLLQLGRYADAVVLLERFRTTFPSREVLNNVGFAHLQLALRFLAACDPALYVRFKLPLVVDPETLAASASVPAPVPQTRGLPAPALSCTSAARFQAPWSEAVRNFQLARNGDPTYTPAYVNLATALLLAGNGTEALNEANSALKVDPANRAAKLQRAVALYLMGGENDIDTLGAAVDALRRLQQADRGSADVAYNLARILTERDRSAAASESWRRFLELERSGSYAAEAARWLPEPPPSPPPPARPKAALPASPLALGSDVMDAKRTLTGEHEIREGSFRGTILRFDSFSALAIDDVVELVEKPSKATASPLDAYGPAQRVESGRRGDLYFYPGLMVEWSPGLARTEVFFHVGAQTSGQR